MHYSLGPDFARETQRPQATAICPIRHSSSRQAKKAQVIQMYLRFYSSDQLLG